jgi:hypothetical protein
MRSAVLVEARFQDRPTSCTNKAPSSLCHRRQGADTGLRYHYLGLIQSGPRDLARRRPGNRP